MKKYLIVFLLALLESLSSCFAVKDADYVANDFYRYLRSGQYNKIISLIDSQALRYSPAREWTKSFEDKQENYGELLSFIRESFDTITKDGKTIVVLKYKVKYTEAIFLETLEFLEREDGFYLTYYQYKEQ